MEKRHLPNARATVEYSASNGRAPRIKGYAAVFYDGTPETEYRLDTTFVERIDKRAFNRALKDQDDVRALFNHDANMILGRTSAGTLDLAKDDRGLRYDIDAGTQLGVQVAESIKRGDITGSSFGFVVEKETFEDNDGVTVRTIQQVQLYDVSPVTFPAYEATEAEARELRERALNGETISVVLDRCKEVQDVLVSLDVDRFRSRAGDA